MDNAMPHPDSETLLRLVDDDLSTLEAVKVGEHVTNCADCRDRVDAFQEAVDDYARFHRDILKPSLPPPSAEWQRLKFPTTGRARLRLAPWIAAAAALIVTVFLARRFENTPEVRAAELLRKATIAEQSPASVHRRIRIRTRSRTLIRAARVSAAGGADESADSAAVQALFIQAGFNWDNPLSAQAFSEWRDKLSSKRDGVEKRSGEFLLKTSSPDGALSDAALLLRANDFHAVECTLHFRSGGETIDVTELAQERASPTPAPTAVTAPPLPELPSTKAPVTATVHDELSVIAALHTIRADLGEPIEVDRDPAAVTVRVTGLSEHRRDQIRTALSGLPAVQLRFEELQHDAARTPLAPGRVTVPADSTNPLLAEVQAWLGNGASLSDLSDEFIDATDRASQRAYALRSLARRFPYDITAQLSSSDSEVLAKMVRDHGAALFDAIAQMRRRLDPILPNAQPSLHPDEYRGGNWQAFAGALPADVDRLDHLLNAATDASEARKKQLAESLATINLIAFGLEHTSPQ